MEQRVNFKKHAAREFRATLDFTTFMLTSHVGLDIPRQGEKRCKLTIGDEVEVSVFDTSVIHEAVNETDEMRYILMRRF